MRGRAARIRKDASTLRIGCSKRVSEQTPDAEERWLSDQATRRHSAQNRWACLTAPDPEIEPYKASGEDDREGKERTPTVCKPPMPLIKASGKSNKCILKLSRTL